MRRIKPIGIVLHQVMPPAFLRGGRDSPQFEGFSKLMRYTNRAAHLLSHAEMEAAGAILYHTAAEWMDGSAMPLQAPAKLCYDAHIPYEMVPIDAHPAQRRLGLVRFAALDIKPSQQLYWDVHTMYSKGLSSLKFDNVFFINGTAYAGKSTMVKWLAQKYNGIACEENYHDSVISGLDSGEFPCLTYTRDLQDWHDFVRRSPDEYEAWVKGVSKECETLELQILDNLHTAGRPVFVDTNISIGTLREISDYNHVLIMLADPDISVSRFFERPDREKQFLYRLLMEEPDPERALENFRQCLKRINSPAEYNRFLHAGFRVICRDENRSIEETLALVERAFGLQK